MKRIVAAAAVAIGIATAGCGGSQAAQQCATYKANAQTWAQNYVSTMQGVSPSTEQQLAAVTYQATAASHRVRCP